MTLRHGVRSRQLFAPRVERVFCARKIKRVAGAQAQRGDATARVHDSLVATVESCEVSARAALCGTAPVRARLVADARHTLRAQLTTARYAARRPDTPRSGGRGRRRANPARITIINTSNTQHQTHHQRSHHHNTPHRS